MNKSRMQKQNLQCSKPKPPLPACNLPKWLFASKIFTLFHTGVIEISWQVSWKLAFWNSKRFMSSLMYRLYRFIGISKYGERERERNSHLHLWVDSPIFSGERAGSVQNEQIQRCCSFLLGEGGLWPGLLVGVSFWNLTRSGCTQWAAPDFAGLIAGSSEIFRPYRPWSIVCQCLSNFR